jgi:hypothetical protein
VNELACENIWRMLVTLAVFHREMSWLKSYFSLNRSSMLVTSETSQSGISALPAAPQSAPPAEQQFSPEDTAARQLLTAVCKAAELVNAAACAAHKREITTRAAHATRIRREATIEDARARSRGDRERVGAVEAPTSSKISAFDPRRGDIGDGARFRRSKPEFVVSGM